MFYTFVVDWPLMFTNMSSKLIFSSFHELTQSRCVRRLSVCKLFAQIASTTTQMARLRPNLHMMIAYPGERASRVCQGQGHGHVTYMIAQKSLLLPR